jgi:hypothetical protein
MAANATKPDLPWTPNEGLAIRTLRGVRFRQPRTEGDQELIDLVIERLDNISPAAHAFARAEYAQQLANYDDRELRGTTLQYLFTLALALLGIAGTVAASLGTSGGSWKTVAIIAGALVAAVTALNQAWSPGTIAV